jgi:hypothetical protein
MQSETQAARETLSQSLTPAQRKRLSYAALVVLSRERGGWERAVEQNGRGAAIVGAMFLGMGTACLETPTFGSKERSTLRLPIPLAAPTTASRSGYRTASRMAA